MRERLDAKNNPRDYGIARNLGRDHEIEKPYWSPNSTEVSRFLLVFKV